MNLLKRHVGCTSRSPPIIEKETHEEVTNDEPQDVTFQTDITFFDQQTNQVKLVQREEIDQLLSLLRKHFPDVIAVTPVLPFLIIECSTLPDPAKQPFMIAGLVAVFTNEGGPYPFGADFIREISSAKQDDPTTVPARSSPT